MKKKFSSRWMHPENSECKGGSQNQWQRSASVESSVYRKWVWLTAGIAGSHFDCTGIDWHKTNTLVRAKKTTRMYWYTSSWRFNYQQYCSALDPGVVGWERRIIPRSRPIQRHCSQPPCTVMSRQSSNTQCPQANFMLPWGFCHRRVGLIMSLT